MLQLSQGRKFIRYVSLSVLGALGVSCYILADTFFIARGMGADGLTALNIAIPVYNFIHGTGMMLGMGGATKFAISRHGQDRQQGNVIFSHAVIAALICGSLFSIAGLLFSHPLAALLGADGAVLAMTDTYLMWLMCFAPAFIMNDVLLCFVRNDDSPLLSTVAMMIGSLANILLDYILIFPMGLGILGAVLATGFSPVISMAIMSLHWIRKKNTLSLSFSKPRWRLLGHMVSLGFPSLVGQVAAGVSMIVFNMLILSLEGNVGVAAYGVVANIAIVMVAVYTGIAEGTQPLFSDAYGRGNLCAIRQNMRYALITVAVFSGMIYMVIGSCAESITAVFNSESNECLREIAVQGLRLYFTSSIFVGFNTVLAIFFVSTEKAMPAHILSLLRGLVLLIPMAFLLAALLHMTGVWLTYPVTEGIVAILGAAVYLRQRKHEIHASV